MVYRLPKPQEYVICYASFRWFCAIALPTFGVQIGVAVLDSGLDCNNGKNGN